MYKPILTRALDRHNNLSSTFFITYKKNHDEVRKSPKPIAKKVEKMKKYWFSRYLDYLQNYDQTLEKTFPKMMHVYRIISTGTKHFYDDFKSYILVRKKNYQQGIDSLSLEELRVNFTLPRDFVKISPTLLLLAIPFTNYVLFPLAFFFPRKILTSHYWTEQQKNEFMILEHKQRSKHKAQLFRIVQIRAPKSKGEETTDPWRNVVLKVKNGERPSCSEILNCKEMFLDVPFALKSLKRNHVNELLRVHEMSTWKWWGRRALLLDRGLLIKKMDVAISREGGVDQLTTNSLKWALSFRGINPVNLSQDDMQKSLDDWLRISSDVDKDSISLLLHCPIFIACDCDSKNVTS